MSGKGIDMEIVDLRSPLPLDVDTVLASARKTSKVLLLHEDTRTGGLGGETRGPHFRERFRISGRPHRAHRGAGHASALQPAA